LEEVAMPKLGKFENVNLSFGVRVDLRDKLVALAYLRGEAGVYARVVRYLLKAAVEDEINSLTPQEHKEFDEILENVRAETKVKDEQRKERVRRRAEKHSARDRGEDLLAESVT